MKIRLLHIINIIILSLLLFSCKKELSLEQKMIKYGESTHKRWNYKINSTFEGNFTDSGYREILVCFDLLHKKENTEFDDTKLFIIDANSEIIKVYDVFYKKDWSNNTNYIKEINNFKNHYRNTVITDFNKHGRLELIYFHEEGSVSVFYIEEFKNGEFQHICQTYDGKLNQPGIDNFDLTHFDFEAKSLYLSDRETPEKIMLTWNPETEFYEKEILQK